MNVDVTTKVNKTSTYRVTIAEGESLWRLIDHIKDLPPDAICEYSCILEFEVEKPMSPTPSDTLIKNIVELCKLKDSRILAIKLVREISREKNEDGIGLLEAKELVEKYWYATPSPSNN